MTLPTEPIRAEHRDLLPHLEHLEAASRELPSWDAATAAARLPRYVEFLSGHLIPHAVAEDEHLYPAINEVAGSPVATATMRADHDEIATRVGSFAASVDEALEDWDGGTHAGALAHQLAGLSAIVSLHFKKEEEVLLPLLDEAMTPAEVAAIYQHMGHAHGDHDHGEHEH
ncbi:MAG: hemerythrin domain-containing protein [Acidimicrobiia bacterium]